ncbi:MAG: phospholipase [Cytophagaceae bacterium]|nr:phospholipase [Cytophagaceae bacterium]
MRYITAILLLFTSLVALAQDGFEKKVFIKDGDSLNYQILLPRNFDKNKQYPLVLFLHGSGERGNDNESQLVHGSKVFLDEGNRAAFPAVVVFPQCPKDSYWANVDVDRSVMPLGFKFNPDAAPTKAMQGVLDLVDGLLAQAFIKKDQIYVAGLSMGGMGTYELLSRKPETFAAAIAICGGGSTSLVQKYALNTPMWVLHGAQDNVVTPQHSLDMVSALLDAGAFPRFTLYENANHNSWDAAFAEPDFLSWLFKHNLSKN